MKRLLALVAIATLMFGGSAAVSWVLTRHQLASAEPVEAAPAVPTPDRDHGHQPAAALPRAASAPSSSAGLHPVQPPGAEETVQLAANLRNRLAEVKEKEARVDARQKHLDLVYRDIKEERTAIEELRKQITEEIKKAPKPSAVAEHQQTKVMTPASPNEKHAHGPEELLPPPKPEKPDTDNMRIAAKILENEPPELTARLFEKLAATGKTATAVKLLADLPEKQAAKVLASMDDSRLAAELLERARDSKRINPQTIKGP